MDICGRMAAARLVVGASLDGTLSTHVVLVQPEYRTGCVLFLHVVLHKEGEIIARELTEPQSIPARSSLHRAEWPWVDAQSGA